MIVDPANPPEYVIRTFGTQISGSYFDYRVLPFLKKELSEQNINLKAIINTHQ